ncbi:hypothetical protein SAMN02799630_00646 [Paenibacillus sp. UNCCL117]|uniref:hypothetical protein n=1 Tax=unclassified Paenibacillus TaxID=185978 RepID=UPI0008871C57|nr:MULTISPECIES: hypothetical protein [unclassified Paenibacillus]SDC14627.1 hypothetical protein SAMN04488602_101445 [Paenibacillus sp. cl123]SFW17346.1 hypothetical protein SAMN02799630_00646 [Paenibacillus sp. UNCCL117]
MKFNICYKGKVLYGPLREDEALAKMKSMTALFENLELKPVQASAKLLELEDSKKPKKNKGLQ